MFNPADPFDAAALYDMWFNCADCDKIFDFEPHLPINLDYYHELGQAARAQGWFAAQLAGTDVDNPEYEVLCPHCAARKGVSGQAMVQEPVSGAIAALCHSLSAAA